MAARPAMPPTTPPTMAPTGVELVSVVLPELVFELLVSVLVPSVAPEVGFGESGGLVSCNCHRIGMRGGFKHVLVDDSVANIFRTSSEDHSTFASDLNLSVTKRNS